MRTIFASIVPFSPVQKAAKLEVQVPDILNQVSKVEKSALWHCEIPLVSMIKVERETSKLSTCQMKQTILHTAIDQLDRQILKSSENKTYRYDTREDMTINVFSHTRVVYQILQRVLLNSKMIT